LGRKYQTLKRRKPFRLTIENGAIVFYPSSGTPFHPELKRYVEEFNHHRSFRPSDYSGDLWSRSYFVALIAAMFIEGYQHGVREMNERPEVPSEELEKKVRVLRRRGTSVTPMGQAKPERAATTVVQIKRDPAVKAWVVEFAKGRCELCKKVAPFKDDDGDPFLELHHVHPLGDDGPDTITNAVALCPNCHRACHLSRSRRRLAAVLYRRCSRLLPPIINR
jgi:5-methylcytosine-specific restriction endonuclease McrA